MNKLLSSLICISPLVLSVSAAPAHAQTTLPTPNTTGDGSVAAVTPPDGADRSTAVASPTNPGATGSKIIPGDNSTMRGDRAATYDQKSGVMSK
jgi:hypothetical protein